MVGKYPYHFPLYGGREGERYFLSLWEREREEVSLEFYGH
jgi:hypothetical protein